MTTRSQFRIPDGLYEELKKWAQANHRSVNAELVARLEKSLGDEPEVAPALTGEDKESTLKPCPFCGTDDAFVERGTLSSCFVMCNQCQARGPDTCPEDDRDLELEEENDWEPGEAAARRLWNRRA